MGGWTYEQKKIWNAKNPEKIREYRKRYQAKHAKEIKRKRRKYYQKNKEVILEANKRYRTKHPEYYDKFRNMMDKTIHNRVISFEDYDDNIMIATIDIQIEYRTKLERGVIE